MELASRCLTARPRDPTHHFMEKTELQKREVPRCLTQPWKDFRSTATGLAGRARRRNRVEWDEFDYDSTHVAILDEQSEVIGAVRMIKSGAPWMLDTVFSALV